MTNRRIDAAGCTKVSFVVLGEPMGKGRPRFTPNGRPYTPTKTANYETLVHLEYMSQCAGFRFPDSSMLDMRIIAYYGIPKSKSKKVQELMKRHAIRPTKKPDADNILKVVADSLNSVAYRDDVQIVDSSVRKFYSSNPRIEVSISLIP